jgi:hypothetical protein
MDYDGVLMLNCGEVYLKCIFYAFGYWVALCAFNYISITYEKKMHLGYEVGLFISCICSSTKVLA